MIDNSQTKNIEVAIEAFRTIKKAVQEYGFCPRELKTTPLDEEDMDNPALRQRLRNNFDEYANIYVAIYNRVLPALIESMRNIESEYNYLTINSRNLKKALDLFTSKISESLIDLEGISKKSGYMKFFIVPLRSYSIISNEEADMYFQKLNDISWNYCQAAIHIRDVFKIKQPWSTPEWEKNRELLENMINDQESGVQDERSESLSAKQPINFQVMRSFSPKTGTFVPYSKLYTYLIEASKIKDIDESTFKDCITHANFVSIYFKGNHVNMLYVIEQLGNLFFGKEWRKAACESIEVDNNHVTKNKPSQKFMDDIMAILKGKETQN